MTLPPRKADDLLALFLAGTGPEAETLLADLILDHALPAIQKTVARGLQGTQAEQREDVAADAVAALIARLRALRGKTADAPPVRDFIGYAAGVADNVVRQRAAARNPERGRLRRRIRLICSNDARFRIWESAQGFWLCGRSGPAEEGKRASEAQLEQCRERLAELPAARELPEFLDRLFREAIFPVELNDLVFVCAGLLGIGNAPEDLELTEDRLADPGRPAGERAEMTAWMARLWKEIEDLPDRQRQALLLNLREPGGAALGLFEDLAVATLERLAAALSMTPKELAEIWNRLPLGDTEIAGRLGISRQQVINLRSAARQRLARRMGNK